MLTPAGQSQNPSLSELRADANEKVHQIETAVARACRDAEEQAKIYRQAREERREFNYSERASKLADDLKDFEQKRVEWIARDRDDTCLRRTRSSVFERRLAGQKEIYRQENERRWQAREKLRLAHERELEEIRQHTPPASVISRRPQGDEVSKAPSDSTMGLQRFLSWLRS